MRKKQKIIPFSLKNAPALIEKVFPAQKLSAEAYKEQMAVHGKTLTALGSYWKGRKPLILNRACILGSLLPATDNPEKDLEIFEKLMGMDKASLVIRMGPSKATPDTSYRDLINDALRPEQCFEKLHLQIWDEVNAHLNTQAQSFGELVEQLGIMRFGRRPKVADPFCGSGQIPFEAARMGCDTYASDLNPIACMLTWGALHIVGASPTQRRTLEKKQQHLAERVRSEIDNLGIESDDAGRRAKVFLYCLETTCPQTGWKVPILPTLVISKNYMVIAQLIPNPTQKRYEIEILEKATQEQLAAASKGTLQEEKNENYLVHTINGKSYRTKISTIRGDALNDENVSTNRLRQWNGSDITFRENDIFRERLYCIQWQTTTVHNKKLRVGYQFHAVTTEDLAREQKVFDYVTQHLSEWQKEGWIPNMVIESGDKTDEPIRTRGWTHWHHLFNPRQLLTGALINQHSCAELKFALTRALNKNSRLSRWTPQTSASQGAFDNQALNTLYNYSCRGIVNLDDSLLTKYKEFPFPSASFILRNIPANQLTHENDIYITDPPYGDAVKYEEILEFFIAWLRKNPPKEFAEWIWDSRRSLAIKGEDNDFRKAMIEAYSCMREKMPDNGVQIIMFTHQSGSLWADMANIVWASGLQVTAAWYVMTETNSALRQGNHVKGTVLLVLRKRLGCAKSTRDDLAWEIQEDVETQVSTLTGLNQKAKAKNRYESLFGDADLQMAGYAAALRVLTKYSIINGRVMAEEALRPRQKGQKTFVEELIDFAVEVANRCLVPHDIDQAVWNELSPIERFYLKMLDVETTGSKALDTYQNFAKAFKIKNFKALMASQKANDARLRGAEELGKSEMSNGSEMVGTVLRGVLYALMELQKEVDADKVIAHLGENIPDYFNKRNTIIHLCRYLASRLESHRLEEASAARVLCELVRNQSMK